MTAALACGLLYAGAGVLAATPAPPASGTLLPDPGAETERPITINIDGHIVDSPTPPLLDAGAVFVPLRGVLESLGFMVDYLPSERRIEIARGSTHLFLRLNDPTAVVGTDIVNVTPPRIVEGRAFVPLRSLAELFGYRVSWLAGSRTVAIYTEAGVKVIPTDHRQALDVGGPFGVGIDFTNATPEDVPGLLDAARDSGAGIVKVRFDWSTLEPERGSEFQWPIYDVIVKGARERGLVVVGILGNCTQWASVSTAQNLDEWRNCPPRESDFPAWSNYVKRTVGRYKNDVQAWQVWENPAASNFRSVARTYRRLARLAVDAAHESDPKALVHAAEPGGVSLDFINDLTLNGLTPLLDGIAVYPVSQWQPGALNPAENFLLPYATLREQLQLSDGKPRDYWVGGLTYPTVEIPGVTPGVAKTPETAKITPTATLTGPDAPPPPVHPARPGLIESFSPKAQANYLVRSVSLALAAGSTKVFWSDLRDASSQQRIQPIDPDAGTGLLRADNSRRPAYDAYKTLTSQLKRKPYAGNLGLGQNVVALLFDDSKSGTLVAWSPRNDATLSLSSSGLNPQVPNALYVATRTDSQVLDATGKPIAAPDGIFHLTADPILITNVSIETTRIAALRKDGKPIRLTRSGPSYTNAQSVKASFDKTGGEDGIYWRRYADYGGAAQNQLEQDDRCGLVTESQRNMMDLQSSRPFIYLDVADDFLYFAKGVPITVSVDVHRGTPLPPNSSGDLSSSAIGFRLEYDSPRGFKTTKWQEIERGDGWTTYTFDISDAAFANAQGYDLLINTGGSKSDLVFGSVTVRRAGAARPAQPTVAATP